PNSALVSRTESIEYTEGSDDVSHFRIDTVQFNSDTSLSSNGLKVELREVGDSGQYIGFTTSLTGVETQVFTLTFNNYGDVNSTDKGQYTFTLLEAVDHIEAIDNDSLSFNLPVYAVDSDGDDSEMKPLSVTIEDD
ncbi:hypothetical protein, partial [Vibrio genomosp. F10]|uniref:T1SS-143 repeat domain-containing protein n=1 Tax=Vibrio genomosp. F10 TaxID=723171 RepID=UPI000AC9EE48